ncbi:hypothetical protein [Streptomyces cavernicola]|uniref:Uncharacterized protein n=1 Tax=Streptomyces cavernicola TaxID=3043613 RepID=A0ABT6SJI5_9ACTN|nr:hypothetical protein [Streptomyces sp. B-S-A6]MDI3408365.1 hypothetical protein [Streptomyces sp. B-S-A6]
MSDDHSYEIRDLDERTGSLESELSSLRYKFGDVEDLDHELRDIRDDVSSAEDDLSSLDDDVRAHIADTERALKRLTARIQAIEAHASIAGGMPVADFDTIDAEWPQLARAAERGRQARAGLLNDAERYDNLSRIQAHASAVEYRDQHRDAAVEAARVLASTPRTDGEHKKAEWNFQNSQRLADSHGQRAEKLAGFAEKAQAALDQDDALLASKAALLQKAEKAEKKLDWLLRGRLADAVRDRALLPMWFVTALGPVPPASRTQEWMDAGTRLLAYRVTCEVKDQVVALGSMPDGHQEPLRAAWYQELTQDLRSWR